MKNKPVQMFIVGLLLLVTLVPITLAAPAAPLTKPMLYLWNSDTLEDARQKVQSGDPGVYRQAVNFLKLEADAALLQGPFSVTYKKSTPRSGDKHDYVSVGIYWWPNPDTPSGLPYVRRDGQVNPEVNGDTFDKTSIGKMSSSVQTLALAYTLTRQDNYAEHAAKLLKVWFLNPATRMNPNLQFGQSVPGKTDGRAEGIVETITFTNVCEAASLLVGSAYWSETDQNGLKVWMGDYLKWLLESPIGKDEANAKNNHGTWYDVQVVYYALFSGQKDLAQKLLTQNSEMRIISQIDPNGQMPGEISRTRSFHYPLYNLRAFISLAILGNQAGCDLWHYQSNDGRSIKKALDWLVPYLDGSTPWPYAQILEENESSAAFYLRAAGAAYNDNRYFVAADKLLGKDSLTSRSNLIGPRPPVK